MKRSKHSLSHYVLSTFDMGQLIPVGNFEVLPGDSVRMATSALLRVSPLMTPVMHPVTVRIHHWFVPYRILWDEWEDFITGGPDGISGSVPMFGSGGGGTGMNAGALSDYLGIPTGWTTSDAAPVSQLPFMAYNSIFNEYYRDQDLQTEVALNDRQIKNCAWEKDYFTSARPWTQKGPDVTLPIGAAAPIVPAGDGQPTYTMAGAGSFKLRGSSSSSETARAEWNPAPSPSTGLASAWLDPKLQADLTQATSSTINDVRRAFALQRYQEARAQYGSRYTEYLRYLGVKSSDARLQRPEYLGGGKATIQFSEVLRTGNESTAVDPETPIGELKGHGISALRSRTFTRFFEEHGVVMTLCSIRPKTLYANGLFRKWSRTTKEDYWQKELELIGQQEIFNREVFTTAANPAGVFGYQDRYADYRHHPSYVCGDFRSTLEDWHLARIFATEPVLNEDFIKCVPSKRIHAEQTQDVIWGMFNHSIKARRLVGHRTIGRIV